MLTLVGKRCFGAHFAVCGTFSRYSKQAYTQSDWESVCPHTPRGSDFVNVLRTRCAAVFHVISGILRGFDTVVTFDDPKSKIDTPTTRRRKKKRCDFQRISVREPM